MAKVVAVLNHEDYTAVPGYGFGVFVSRGPEGYPEIQSLNKTVFDFITDKVRQKRGYDAAQVDSKWFWVPFDPNTEDSDDYWDIVQEANAFANTSAASGIAAPVPYSPTTPLPPVQGAPVYQPPATTTKGDSTPKASVAPTGGMSTGMKIGIGLVATAVAGGGLWYFLQKR